MKNRRLVQILGCAMLIASLGITGCNVNVSKDAEKETTEETTEKETTTTEDEEDLCCCVVDEDYDDDEVYYSSSFQSTNGELPGQMDYMVLCPDWEELDYENYPDNDYTTDLSSISDDGVRAYGQSLLDDGYSVYDPELYQEYGYAWGDGEYQFTTGFSAFRNEGRLYEYIDAYKMNEDLFNYFFVEMFDLDDPDVPVTDDGTVIRYGEDNNYVEFHRDTGLGISYSAWDEDEGLG